jgi:formylglycine-generating enzyme required for sulfatase activity
MLTGRLPYPQTDDAALIGALLTREPEPPPDDLPGVLREVLIHSLQKNPVERYQSVVEMREALRGNIHPPAPVPPAPQAASELEFPTQKFTVSSVEPIVVSPPPFPQSPPLTPGDSERQAPKPQFTPTQKIIAPVPFISGSSPPFQSGVPEQRRGSLWLVVSVLAGVLIVGLAIALSLGAFSSRNASSLSKDDSTIRQPATPRATTETSSATTSGSALPPLRSYQFDTVKVDSKGNVIERRQGQAQSFSENIGGVAFEMVKIPSGTFTMGSPATEKKRDGDDNEGPQHQVSVPEFYMGKYEVTQAQWRAVASLPKVEIDLNPSPSKFKGDRQPIEQVSWDEAVEFCARLSNATGREYRLPSEAEWEYAARAGTQTPFAFGETITPEIVNYDGNYPYGGAAKGIFREQTTAVGALSVANGFGLYDLHGNVAEWCLDVRHGTYNGAPTDGTAWISDGYSTHRMLRGGSWYLSSSGSRSANRDSTYHDDRSFSYGFRVVALART